MCHSEQAKGAKAASGTPDKGLSGVYSMNIVASTDGAGMVRSLGMVTLVWIQMVVLQNKE